MKRILVILLFLWSGVSKASNLQLSQPILYIEDEMHYAIFNLSWDNAWHNDKNNDGIWIFFKSILNEGGYGHIRIMDVGHSVISNFSKDEPDLEFEVASDAVGMFLFLKKDYRGKIETTIKVVLDSKSFEGINTRESTLQVIGIEMVKIPDGGFELGSTDLSAIKYGSFYKPDQNGEIEGLVTIVSEDQELEVSESGAIYYQNNEGYEGDQKGIIPSSFPKGVSPFYIMKYEPTEGQYVGFLNSLDSIQIMNRMIFHEENYYKQGGTIIKSDGHYISSHPNKPCQFMSWDDAMAYADWAGLRPMTEFEFTKAARGIEKAKAKEFPWGTANKLKMQRHADSDGNLVMLNGWDESKLTDNTMEYFGASYYWVMDLAGSMWERVITVGHPNGRNFNGSHGDGMLSSLGMASNQNWPIGKEDSGGIGFRGGGFYGYDRSYHEFNPFSPIAYRPYGGWHGGMSTNSYGARFVRSSSK